MDLLPIGAALHLRQHEIDCSLMAAPNRRYRASHSARLAGVAGTQAQPMVFIRQRLTCCSRPCLRVEQRSDCRVTARPVERAAAARAYASDRYAQLVTDLGVRHWRVSDK